MITMITIIIYTWAEMANGVDGEEILHNFMSKKSHHASSIVGLLIIIEAAIEFILLIWRAIFRKR